MSWKTVFITRSKWNKLSTDLRDAITDIIPRHQVLDRYAVAIADQLRVNGKNELAEQFKKEVTMYILNKDIEEEK